MECRAIGVFLLLVHKFVEVNRCFTRGAQRRATSTAMEQVSVQRPAQRHFSGVSVYVCHWESSDRTKMYVFSKNIK